MSSSDDKVVPATSLDAGSRRWMSTQDGGFTVLRLNGGYTMRLSGITSVRNLREGKYKVYFLVKLENPQDVVWQSCKVTFQLRAGRTVKVTEEVDLGKVITDSTKYFPVPTQGLNFNYDKEQHRFVSFVMSEIESDEWKEGLLVREVLLQRQAE